MEKNLIRDKLQTGHSTPEFEPTMKSLMRIMKFMSENPSGGKTALSLDTKMNYGRLSNHVVWMEKKGLAQSTVLDGKVNISLTGNGRILANTLLIV